MSDIAVHRVHLDHDPYAGSDPHWSRRAVWPAHWIGVEAAPPLVAGYRLRFRTETPVDVTLHVSADERYELFLDGDRIGRGPERGEVDYWPFESFQVELPAGDHLLAARVWSLGDEAPYAQHSFGHGFLLAADGADLNTGVAEWETALLPGHGLRPKGDAWGCGAKHVSDGRTFPWGWEVGSDSLNWGAPVVADRGYAHDWVNDMSPGRMLVPAILPDQYEGAHEGGLVRHVADHPDESTHATPVRAADSLPVEVEHWQNLIDGQSVTVPAHTRRRVIIDLDDYVCAYPELVLTGGRDASVRVHWQESLYTTDGLKGDRNQIEGRLFGRPELTEDGPGDLFIAGGGDGESHSTLWWEAGRYVEVLVVTAEAPLTISELRFVENRYPYTDVSTFRSSDPQLERIKQLAYRTLQMCSHETTMDCPYYEQLQYAGDTRLQLLVAYVTGDDDRLARQALLAFDRSRTPDGLTRSRHPSRIVQRIPPFSLWWVAMVHDFALWRGDLDFVAGLMPGIRAVLDAHRAQLREDGLFHSINGWNFTDWVSDWAAGAPPGAHWDVSSVLNLQLALVADKAAQLEDWMQEPEMAARHRRLATDLRAAVELHFYLPDRGLYADDLDGTLFSEHAQSLALLAGSEHGPEAVDAMIAAGPESDLVRTTVYFDHYLFEALAAAGRTDVLLQRLDLWRDLLDLGMRTVVEQPEPTRSDCHAWGAHPIFHYVSSLLGVRPTAPGMSAVTIRPDLGGLEWAEATFPTPHGPIHVRAEGNSVTAEVPDGITLTP